MSKRIRLVELKK